jgi:hypothetical protein
MENENPLKSSKVGWPFWIPVILTTIPFTILFLHLSPDYKSYPWWKTAMAGIVGLVPAMLLGLIIQTLWAIVVAVAKGKFILVDFFFTFLLLAFGAGLTLFNLRENVLDTNTESLVFFFIIVPLIGFYVRKRTKRKANNFKN